MCSSPFVCQVESESDPEPDVIPLQEGCRPPDLEPLPATLLPPSRYQYGPVPASTPPTVRLRDSLPLRDSQSSLYEQESVCMCASICVS